MIDSDTFLADLRVSCLALNASVVLYINSILMGLVDKHADLKTTEMPRRALLPRYSKDIRT